jgi:hypothetical protein
MSSRTGTLLFACLWTSWCQAQGQLEFEVQNATLSGKDTSATLNCSLIGVLPQDVELLWYKDEKQVWADERHVIVASIGSGYTSLRINRVNETDVGDYECRTMINGTSRAASVVLYAAPHVGIVMHGKKSITLVEGETLAAECRTWGWPVPTLIWKQLSDAGQPEDLDPRANVTHGEIGGNLTTSNLTLHNVILSDRGNYKCIGTNDIDVTDDVVYVRVKAAIAPLWPFIGILVEIALLIVVIFIYEWQKKKKQAAAERKEN